MVNIPTWFGISLLASGIVVPILVFIIPLIVIAVTLHIFGLKKGAVAKHSLFWFVLYVASLYIFSDLIIRTLPSPIQTILIGCGINLTVAMICFLRLKLAQIGRKNRLVFGAVVLIVQSLVFGASFALFQTHINSPPESSILELSNLLKFQDSAYVFEGGQGLYQIDELGKLKIIAPKPRNLFSTILATDKSNVYLLGSTDKSAINDKNQIYILKEKEFLPVDLPMGTKSLLSIQSGEGRLLALLNMGQGSELWIREEKTWTQLGPSHFMSGFFNDKWFFPKYYGKDIIIDTLSTPGELKNLKEYKFANFKNFVQIGNDLYSLKIYDIEPGSQENLNTEVVKFSLDGQWTVLPLTVPKMVTKLSVKEDSLFLEGDDGRVYKLKENDPVSVTEVFSDSPHPIESNGNKEASIESGKPDQGLPKYFLDGVPCYKSYYKRPYTLDCGTLKYPKESDLFSGRINYKYSYHFLGDSLISQNELIYGVTNNCIVAKFSKKSGKLISSNRLTGAGGECRVFKINNKIFIIGNTGNSFRLENDQWKFLGPVNPGLIVKNGYLSTNKFYNVRGEFYFSSENWLYKYNNGQWDLIFETPDNYIRGVAGSKDRLFILLGGRILDIEDPSNPVNITEELSSEKEGEIYFYSIEYVHPFLYATQYIEIYRYGKGKWENLKKE